ncbi:MAG: ABC transporter ATP-binding protein [Clostridiaceae bacterium]|nr:ABC transporter ATP-binding protein/permease [Eubacteriales bacterium]
MEAVKEKPQRPKFGMASNAAYMVKLAWRVQKSVLFLCLAQVLLGVALQVLGLFFAPTVLKSVENVAPIGQLLGVILQFALALMLAGALKAYAEANTLWGRIVVRLACIEGISEKAALTSYPNMEEQGFLKMMEKAYRTVSSNQEPGEAVWRTLTEIGKSLLGFLIYLALLSSLDPLIALVTLATALAGHFFGKRINEWGYRHREEEAEYARKMEYVTGKADTAALAKDIRIFGMKEWLLDIYHSTQRLYRAFTASGERAYLWADVIDVMLALLRNGVAYAYLIGLVLRQNLSASEFLLYFAAVGGFTAWVTGILSGFSELHKQSVELSGMREFFSYDEPFLFEEGAPLEPEKDKAYEIALKNVSFRYAGAEKDALTGISLTLRPGEKLAVVGLNGAGKTTLVKLICGFYDPAEGEVLLNGVNIKQYNRRDYYRMFSAVFQDFSLLAETVAANVAQADENADMGRVRACVEAAGLAEKIESLPNGLMTYLGKEVYEDAPELSGGETQRLMLARALYMDAPMLVLDEPTAALDPIAESELYQKYNALSRGKTSVFISHRLASTRFCDRILFLADGKIAEEGTHEALLKLGGGYAKLFELQSHYYREGGDRLEEEAGLR